MSNTLNPYEVLNIDESASSDEIKKAYRKLCLSNHPDRNNNSSESTKKFQSITSAYELIGDESKRKQYDMQSKMKSSGMPFMFNQTNGIPFSFMQSTGGGGGGGVFPFASGMSFMQSNSDGGMDFDPSEILNFVTSNIFGNQFTNNNNNNNNNKQDKFRVGGGIKLAKPVPIIVTETINISKAYSGYNLPISIVRWIVDGGIKREETETVYIPIPCGIDNNELIVLQNKGNILDDNNKGDVKVFIKINNDSEFERSGLDLILNKSIQLKDALCGFSFEMKFVDGRIFKINTASGNIITHNYSKILPNMGMKRDDSIGNLVIVFNVQFPESLTDEQITTLKSIL